MTHAEGTFVEARAAAWLLQACWLSCMGLQMRVAFLFYIAGLGAGIMCVRASDLKLDLNLGNESGSGACNVKHKRHLYLKKVTLLVTPRFWQPRFIYMMRHFGVRAPPL